MLTQHYVSPCGELLLGSVGGELCLCDWRGVMDRTAVKRRVERYLHADASEGSGAVLQLAAQQLDEYFGGERQSFSVPLRCAGTAFQQRVWQALLQVPYGATLFYAELARATGCPRSVRAVASACGANALSIFVPCHRIIGAGGALTGYAGGIEAKRFLLELEKRWR